MPEGQLKACCDDVWVYMVHPPSCTVGFNDAVILMSSVAGSDGTGFEMSCSEGSTGASSSGSLNSSSGVASALVCGLDDTPGSLE